MTHLITLVTLLCFSFASAFEWFPLGNWIEEEGANILAGHCVANSVDGNTIVISAPYYSPEGNEGLRHGRVVSYKFDELRDAWDKLGDEIVGDAGDNLGWSLGMSEDGKSIIVGAPGNGKNGRRSGMAKVYVLDNATGEEKWIQKGQTMYGSQAFDEFGYSVDIKDGGQVIAVGSPGEDTSDGSLDESGAVRVYKWTSSSKWAVISGVIEGTEAHGRFGESLSLSQVGNLAIGAPYALNSAGTVSMVRYNSTDATWQRTGPIQRTTQIKEGDLFGYAVSVSFDGSTVAIGAPHHKGNDNNLLRRSGAVTIHKYSRGTDEWLQVGNEIIGDAGGDEFGTSVHMSDDGEEVAIGSPYSGTANSPEAGHISVYGYELSGGWQQMNIDIFGKSSYSHLGKSVALSGNGQQVMGGAPTEGYATVYLLAETAPPTSSPTAAPKVKSPGKKRNAFGEFIRVVLLIALCGMIAFAVFKIVQGVRRRQARGSFEPTTPTDLEMTPHGVPVQGDERDVI